MTYKDDRRFTFSSYWKCNEQKWFSIWVEPGHFNVHHRNGMVNGKSFLSLCITVAYVVYGVQSDTTVNLTS